MKHSLDTSLIKWPTSDRGVNEKGTSVIGVKHKVTLLSVPKEMQVPGQCLASARRGPGCRPKSHFYRNASPKILIKASSLAQLFLYCHWCEQREFKWDTNRRNSEMVLRCMYLTPCIVVSLAKSSQSAGPFRAAIFYVDSFSYLSTCSVNG